MKNCIWPFAFSMRTERVMLQASSIMNSEAKGHVWKFGKYLPIWRSTYLIKKENIVFYFATDQNGRPSGPAKGAFDLHQWNMEMCISMDPKHPHVFCLRNAKTREFFFFSPATVEELHIGITCMQYKENKEVVFDETVAKGMDSWHSAAEKASQPRNPQSSGLIVYENDPKQSKR